jgi:hypothetical protein
MISPGFRYTAKYVVNDRWSENPNGYVNVQVFTDEDVFVAEDQYWYDLGYQSVADIEQGVEGKAQELILSFTNHPRGADMLALLALSTAEEGNDSEPVDVDLDGLLDDIIAAVPHYEDELTLIQAELVDLAGKPVVLAHFDEVRAATQFSQTTLGNMSGQQQTMTERVETIKTSIDDVKSLVSQVKDSTANSERYDLLRTDVTSVLGEINALASAVGDNRTINGQRFDDVDESLNFVRADIVALQDDVNAFNTVLTALHHRFDELRGVVEALIPRLDEILEMVTPVEEEVPQAPVQEEETPTEEVVEPIVADPLAINDGNSFERQKRDTLVRSMQAEE